MLLFGSQCFVFCFGSQFRDCLLLFLLFFFFFSLILLSSATRKIPCVVGFLAFFCSVEVFLVVCLILLTQILLHDSAIVWSFVAVD